MPGPAVSSMLARLLIEEPAGVPVRNREVYMNDSSGYDIAVSCADERRSYVEDIVEACKQRGLAVFYDRDKTNEWWLRNAHDGDAGIRVRYFVPVISTEYLTTPSQVDEFSAAMLKAVKRGDGAVLPVLVGSGSVPEDLLHPHIDYLRGDGSTPDELADRLAARVSGSGQQWHGLPDVVTRALHSVPEGAGENAALRYLGEQFQAAAPRLRAGGFVGIVRRTESHVAIRIERQGETVYALEIHDLSTPSPVSSDELLSALDRMAQ